MSKDLVIWQPWNEEQVLLRAERNLQNKYDSAFTTLGNEIRDTEISKYTDSVSEKSVGSKAKKTEGKKQS